jgi:hypothetical protein
MRPEPPVDITDVFGAEQAAHRLAERLTRIDRDAVRRAADGGSELFPALSLARDRFDGPPWARAAIVVFGGFGASASRPLGPILAAIKEQHPNTVSVPWRHHPDPRDLERSALFALAAEAAAGRGHFWPLTRELLGLRHFDPVDLHRALLRAGLDPERTGDVMRAGIGADRIADDVASALASGVAYPPALFVNGERYRGELEPPTVLAALEGVTAAGRATPTVRPARRS